MDRYQFAVLSLHAVHAKVLQNIDEGPGKGAVHGFLKGSLVAGLDGRVVDGTYISITTSMFFFAAYRSDEKAA